MSLSHSTWPGGLSQLLRRGCNLGIPHLAVHVAQPSVEPHDGPTGGHCTQYQPVPTGGAKKLDALNYWYLMTAFSAFESDYRAGGRRSSEIAKALDQETANQTRGLPGLRIQVDMSGLRLL